MRQIVRASWRSLPSRERQTEQSEGREGDRREGEQPLHKTNPCLLTLSASLFHSSASLPPRGETFRKDQSTNQFLEVSPVKGETPGSMLSRNCRTVVRYDTFTTGRAPIEKRAPFGALF